MNRPAQRIGSARSMRRLRGLSHLAGQVRGAQGLVLGASLALLLALPAWAQPGPEAVAPPQEGSASAPPAGAAEKAEKKAKKRAARAKADQAGPGKADGSCWPGAPG